MIDSSLAHSVLLTLGKKGLSLGSVESLTGGLFASSICSIPGASKVFKGGIVSYANEVKEKLVGVNPLTIAQEGVVSQSVALEMAKGGLKALNVDVAVSFTGNAGPTAEAGEAPIGRVYMAIAFKNQAKPFSYAVDLVGSRNEIREKCVNFILVKLAECLK
jgi:PncC family amidohydrolase